MAGGMRSQRAPATGEILKGSWGTQDSRDPPPAVGRCEESSGTAESLFLAPAEPVITCLSWAMWETTTGPVEFAPEGRAAALAA
ncbi:hypothetical protein NDU88_002295 [Pleurodeles waltl]|uniref:Uncharacterized protein n=1 Tax=Pleurodeles waltl TaxID=8319 RepID=A0AAV7Q8W8_PLEWA|nr:hypothetical protein NDU88_002295 [Pleurodeles waltl]